MAGSKWLWTGAGVLSLLAHAGAAAILTMSPAQQEDEALVAGGVVAEVAMLGNSAFDAVESGNPEDAIQPETIEPDITDPVQQEVTEIKPTEVEPQVTDAVQPVDPIVSEPIEELIVPSAEVEIAAVPVPEIKPEIEPENEIKPVPEVKKKEPVKKVEPKKPKRKPVKKAGEKGESRQALSRGEADGSEGVTAALGGQKKGNSSTAGNAAVSNYPGKVRSKINRAKKRVRGGDQGSVVVSFTVGSSGQASGIRISRSSGSADIDRAALDAVQRASPFAKIPDGAGRSSWPFSVPIVFK